MSAITISTDNSPDLLLPSVSFEDEHAVTNNE